MALLHPDSAYKINTIPDKKQCLELEELHLTADIAAVTLRRHVLAQCFHVFPRCKITMWLSTEGKKSRNREGAMLAGKGMLYTRVEGTVSVTPPYSVVTAFSC